MMQKKAKWPLKQRGVKALLIVLSIVIATYIFVRDIETAMIIGIISLLGAVLGLRIEYNEYKRKEE